MDELIDIESYRILKNGRPIEKRYRDPGGNEELCVLMINAYIGVNQTLSELTAQWHDLFVDDVQYEDLTEETQKQIDEHRVKEVFFPEDFKGEVIKVEIDLPPSE